jgi:hypothetical protein
VSCCDRRGREGSETHDLHVRAATRLLCVERVRTLAVHLEDLRSAELPPLPRIIQALGMLVKRYPKSATISEKLVATLAQRLHAHELMV